MQQFLTTMPDKPEEAKAPAMKEDSLFVVQDFQRLTEPAPVQIPEQPVVSQVLTMEHVSTPIVPTVQQPTIAAVAPSPEQKEEEAPAKNFSDYFNSKKHEIENEIATQRKSSK